MPPLFTSRGKKPNVQSALDLAAEANAMTSALSPSVFIAGTSKEREIGGSYRKSADRLADQLAQVVTFFDITAEVDGTTYRVGNTLSDRGNDGAVVLLADRVGLRADRVDTNPGTRKAFFKFARDFDGVLEGFMQSAENHPALSTLRPALALLRHLGHQPVVERVPELSLTRYEVARRKAANLERSLLLAGWDTSSFNTVAKQIFTLHENVAKDGLEVAKAEQLKGLVETLESGTGLKSLLYRKMFYRKALKVVTSIREELTGPEYLSREEANAQRYSTKVFTPEDRINQLRTVVGVVRESAELTREACDTLKSSLFEISGGQDFQISVNGTKYVGTGGGSDSAGMLMEKGRLGNEFVIHGFLPPGDSSLLTLLQNGPDLHDELIKKFALERQQQLEDARGFTAKLIGFRELKRGSNPPSIGSMPSF